MQSDQLIDLAVQYLRAGNASQAEFACRQVVDTEPQNANAWCVLGIAQRAQGQASEAAASFHEALRIRPEFVEARNNLGNVFAGQQRWSEAIPHYQQALEAKPDLVDAMINLGVALKETGQPELAIGCLERALQLSPAQPRIHAILAEARLALGQANEALAHCEQALRLQADFPPALMNKGLALAKLGHAEVGISWLHRAIQVQPGYDATQTNLGNVLLADKRFGAAQIAYEEALRMCPGSSLARYSLGLAHAEQGHLDAAIGNYQEALRLQPGNIDATKNLAVTLLEAARFADARQVFEQLLVITPDSPDAELGLAACDLVRADYERGWPEYEARLRLPGFGPTPDKSRWRGEPLAGRTLLLLAEQGLGDTLHFLRFAREFKVRGARVVLACQPALVPLLSSYVDVDGLFAMDAQRALPDCDYYLPLLSAAGALRTSAETIPHVVPYLTADPASIAKWRQELAKFDGLKVGISWQGSRDYPLDRWRSIPLQQFSPLAGLAGVQLVSLQKGFGSEQVATVDFPVSDLASELDESAGAFMDTAAVLCNLDLVVTSDTAMAHLAGALGVPVWVALPFSANWRWLRDRDDSPWYPTMRLFRQLEYGHWPDVFRRIVDALRTLPIEQGRPPTDSAGLPGAS